MTRRVLLLLAGTMLLGAAPPSPPVALELITGDTLPQRLCDYRFFTDAAAMRPNARVTRYTLNTPLFSDYAEKARFLYVPPGMKAAYAASGTLDFPVGSALIKTFAFPADMRAPSRDARVIETRVLLHRAGGWVALPYIWNADHSDAVLARGGGRTDVAWIAADGRREAISYRIPNSNQCKECHALAGAIQPIGPKPRNLNDGAQLGRLSAAGLVAAPPINIPRLPRWDDAALPIAARARAYLDVNCGHCHNRAGAASNTGLYLTWDEADSTATGLLKRPVAAGRGSGGYEYAIDPGRPERSILLYRMRSVEPGVAMPEQGRATVHREAVDLLGPLDRGDAGAAMILGGRPLAIRLGLALLIVALLLLAAAGALYLYSPPKSLDVLDRLFPDESDARRVAGGVRFAPGPQGMLDVWSTPGPAGAHRPVLIFFYGGAWVKGRREEYGFVARAYAARGFIVVMPDYRKVPGVRFPSFVEDGAAAVRWTRDNIARYGGDPGRIMLSGHSAGAYIAVMLALDRRYLAAVGVDPAIVRAAAGLAGPYDFYPFTSPRSIAAMAGAPDPQMTQPIHFARADAPPLWLVSGTADDEVRPRNAIALAARQHELGSRTTMLRLYPGRSHNDLIMAISRPFRRRLPVLDESVAFFAAHVDLADRQVQ